MSMPGVPHEMIRMFGDIVLPKISERFLGGAIVHRVLLVQGVPESQLSIMLEPWELALPANIRLAYLPNLGMIRLRLTARGVNNEELAREVDEQVSLVRPVLGHHLVSDHAGSIEEAVAELMRGQGATLSLAESCTGGGLARRITSVPGSSHYFKGCVVAYDNDLKSRMLRVNKGSLRKYGAVSAPVAEEMARGGAIQT